MSQFIKSVDAEDAYIEAYKLRCMIEYIEKTYPKNYEDILRKTLDITPYEVQTLTYTPAQYKRLEQYCAKQGFKQKLILN